jgi:hypothetical protein
VSEKPEEIEDGPRDESSQAASSQTESLQAKLGDEDVKRIIEGTVAALAERLPARDPEPMEGKPSLEKQLEEVKRAAEEYRQRAESAERSATVRDELRRLGVTNVELAFRAVREDVFRDESGELKARAEQGEVGLRQYLERFVEANPELLPSRRLGGAGSSGSADSAEDRPGMDLNSIRPGMDPAEMERARREVARVISQSLQRR